MMKQRIESLDWLRGLMAVSIMLYHFTGWSIRPFDDVSSVIVRLGTYAVSIFFILSGLSIAIAYNNNIKGFNTWVSFYIRRIFRIWPLLWLVCIIITIQKINYGFDWKLLFINLTTLYGFVKPDAAIFSGGWSIGNEMVYYLVSPLIILTFNNKKKIGNLLFIISILIGLIFSNFLLSKTILLSQQWSIYINPLNNLFLFISGIAIYYNLNKLKINQKLNAILLLIIIMAFIFYPISGNQILIVTGFERLFFVLVSFLAVVFFYKFSLTIPKIINNFLTQLGIASYGIYILHPIIFPYGKFFYDSLFRKMFPFLNSTEQGIFLIIFCSILTFIASVLIYYFFEKKMIIVGKKLSKNIKYLNF